MRTPCLFSIRHIAALVAAIHDRGRAGAPGVISGKQIAAMRTLDAGGVGICNPGFIRKTSPPSDG